MSTCLWCTEGLSANLTQVALCSSFSDGTLCNRQKTETAALSLSTNLAVLPSGTVPVAGLHRRRAVLSSFVSRKMYTPCCL